MARHGEYAMLIAATNASLVRSLDDGDLKSYDGNWLHQSPLEHMRHAFEHICEMLNNGDDTGEHLDHALTRLAMLKIIRDGAHSHGH